MRSLNALVVLVVTMVLIVLGHLVAGCGDMGQITAPATAPATSTTGRSPDSATPAQTTSSAQETIMAAKKTPTKTPKPTSRPSPPATPRPTEAAGYAQQVLQAVNRYRVAQGRAELAWDDRLGTFAQRRAEDMLARDYFSHTDPKTGELFLGQLGSVRANGETLYQLEGGVAPYLSKLDDLAVTDWKNSAAHAAIMGDKRMTRAGVGVAVESRRAVVVLIVEQ